MCLGKCRALDVGALRKKKCFDGRILAKTGSFMTKWTKLNRKQLFRHRILADIDSFMTKWTKLNRKLLFRHRNWSFHSLLDHKITLKLFFNKNQLSNSSCGESIYWTSFNSSESWAETAWFQVLQTFIIRNNKYERFSSTNDLTSQRINVKRSFQEFVHLKQKKLTMERKSWRFLIDFIEKAAKRAKFIKKNQANTLIQFKKFKDERLENLCSNQTLIKTISSRSQFYVQIK